MVVTRFAPSPTGLLHIGGARTALFNYLFAKRHGGKFLLRIEDTDKERSTTAAIEAIISGLKWLGLDWDGPEIYQSKRYARHLEVAEQLLKSGNAYYCYTSQEELAEHRALNPHAAFASKWRDQTDLPSPDGIKPVIRLKSPKTGSTIIHDVVQGDVTIDNVQSDDMILVRSDQTPTYMFAVVVDDHDMQISHIIRGDDHLTNAARQILIYQALNWEIPVFAHIPLIHGPDGAKLSKRHGTLGVEAYRDMGYLAETMCNYLLRLGWSHHDDEIISRAQAIEWFNLENIGKSPARLDFKKLDNLNVHYTKEKSSPELFELIKPLITQELNSNIDLVNHKELLVKAIDLLKPRAKNLNELAASTAIFIQPKEPEIDLIKTLDSSHYKLLAAITELLENIEVWDHNIIKEKITLYITENSLKMSDVAKIIRVALTGYTESAGIFDMMAILGKDNTITRLKNFINKYSN